VGNIDSEEEPYIRHVRIIQKEVMYPPNCVVMREDEIVEILKTLDGLKNKLQKIRNTVK